MKYKKTMVAIALISIFSNQAFAERSHDGSSHGKNTQEINHKYSIGSEPAQKKEKENEAMKQMPNMVHSDGSTMTVKSEDTKK